MLTDVNKTNTLWKNYKGWGSTHPERAEFEELYRSYKEISTNSILTYGDLLPRKQEDKFFEAVQELDSTNNILYYDESSFKQVPLLKKYTDFQVTAISSNCDHAFAILDENGNQIKNIIPYDFSDTGLYNITLKTSAGEEVAWGINDWLVDTNSSLLTFNNGVPEGISAENPPTLTFYQYVGPVGERHYIDAALFDIENVLFEAYKPTTYFTKQVEEYLDNIESGFFKKYGFGGNDVTNGIGLQYNILSNTTDTVTGDPLKGYDDNSNSQVVHLLSHKKGSATGITVLFVSEGIQNDTYKIQVDKPEYNNISKVDVDDGFFVVIAEPGTYEITVSDDDKISAVLLAKDNETQEYELFYPREQTSVTLKLPVFVDLINLPPHLKLTALSSYSDHITPQYYGPRTVDFVIASDNSSVNYRSADFVVYNKDNFYLSDAFAAIDGHHILLRNGLYKNGTEKLLVPNNLVISGETLSQTFISDSSIEIENNVLVENITFKNCKITLKGKSTFRNCNFEEESNVIVENEEDLVILKNISLGALEISGNIQIFDSRIESITSTGTVSLYNTSVINTFESKGKSVELYSSYVQTFNHSAGIFYINSSRIETFNCTFADEKSIINTTNIDYVEALPINIKIDASYVTKFSENISRERYPDVQTIPYYTSFENRVYAKIEAPFKYNEEDNTIHLLLDSVQNTIYINENGELQCRFFSSKEIYLDNPDAIQTQIELVYGEHADTVLDKDKPTNLDEAIIDLYWSKADLQNGKIPIDQLPDSVAYGGLNLVGMWSFEDSEGKYPTFADVDTKYSSDDEYTDLQNGWFFIIKASHQDDDPFYPQKSEDGETFIAGDWLIYVGGPKRVIDYTKELSFTYKGKPAKVFSVDPDEGSITYEIPVEKVKDSDSDTGNSSNSGESSGSSSGSSDVYLDYGTITVDNKGYVTKVYNIQDIEIGSLIRSIRGLRITRATYSEIATEANWHKLDRSMLDPVYARLPELAAKTGDDNPQWSIEDGGTGLLRLSYKTLAEAIRLINETLLKLSPARPASIQTITVVLDEDKTTAVQQEYIPVAEGLQLNQLVQRDTKKTWNATKGGRIYFKQAGVHDQLPLEHSFYCGTSSTIKVKDDTRDITNQSKIERFDPYEKYRLGFRYPTVMDAAEVSGYVELAQGAYNLTHHIKYSQYDVKTVAQVTDPVSMLEGETKELTFNERLFYEFDDYSIKTCEEGTVNLRVLNELLETNRTGGFGFIPNKTNVIGTFIIKNFTKYGTITKDAKVEVKATFEEMNIPVEITSQMFVVSDLSQEIYDLSVSFTLSLPDVDYKEGSLIVSASVRNFGKESKWANVLAIKDLVIMNPSIIPTIVESAGNSLWPSYGENDIYSQFGKDYKLKTYNEIVTFPELMFNGYGYGWPTKSTFVNQIRPFGNSTYVTPNSKGLVVGSNRYRFITFKRSFDTIRDLCGFNVKLNWLNPPTINELNGSLNNTILQICVRSPELQNENLLDGNSAVPVFFEATLSQGEACNHPGKSTVDIRRITFGRNPIAIQDIYVRIGIAKDSNTRISGVEIITD